MSTTDKIYVDVGELLSSEDPVEYRIFVGGL
jgi:hypothetical protein